jgi:hypothetical protein
MAEADYEDLHGEIVQTRKATIAKIACLADEMGERIARLEQRVAQLQSRGLHICPMCHGEKVIMHAGNGQGDDPSEDVDCPICEGAGSLNDAELTYYLYYDASLKAKVRPMSVGQEIPI